MPEQNPNPAPTPSGDQPAGNQQTPPQGAPPVGQKPPATDLSQSPGGEQKPDEQATVNLEEFNALKRKAGRWDAQQKSNRDSRRDDRRKRTKDDYNADNADPELLESLRTRDDKIDELSSVNTRLEVKNRVRDLIDGDEYKDLSASIKRAVAKNPLGFANASSQEIGDIIADIQDYLDDELDHAASTQPPAPNQGDNPPAGNPQSRAIGTSQQPAIQTPPAGGSGPSSPNALPFEGTEGLTGSKRSVKVLGNILKTRK